MKYYKQHAAAYLPASSAMPIEMWNLRFISVSSVSSSAFHTFSTSSLEGLAASQKSATMRQARHSKTVSWRDHEKSDLATTPTGKMKEPTDWLMTDSSNEQPNPQPILLGSALKASPSYEVMTLPHSAPLRSASQAAPYYPTSRGTPHNDRKEGLQHVSAGLSVTMERRGDSCGQGHGDSSNSSSSSSSISSSNSSSSIVEGEEGGEEEGERAKDDSESDFILGGHEEEDDSEGDIDFAEGNDTEGDNTANFSK